jgi:hypothetical protein
MRRDATDLIDERPSMIVRPIPNSKASQAGERKRVVNLLLRTHFAGASQRSTVEESSRAIPFPPRGAAGECWSGRTSRFRRTSGRCSRGSPQGWYPVVKRDVHRRQALAVNKSGNDSGKAKTGKPTNVMAVADGLVILWVARITQTRLGKSRPSNTRPSDKQPFRAPGLAPRERSREGPYATRRPTAILYCLGEKIARSS